MNQHENIGSGSFGEPDPSQANMPIGVGDFTADDAALDPLAGSETGPKFRAGTILLVLVVLIAGAGLWFMRKVGSVSASTAKRNDLEKAVESFLASRNAPGGASAQQPGFLSQSDGVLTVLSESYTQRQVPLDSVQRDPFVIFAETAVKPGNDGNESQRIRERRAQIDQAAAQVQLKSIIMSSEPMAHVGGKICRVGDTFVAQPHNVTFRVTGITSGAVSMTGEDTAIGVSVPVTVQLRRNN